MQLIQNSQARLGCTCSWLIGYGVGKEPEIWAEKMLSEDEDCIVHKEITKNGRKGKTKSGTVR